MKRILNPTGGRPIKNEDLALYEQILDMLQDSYEALGVNGIIISGCVISGSDVSSGYIYYDNKICAFEGASGVSFPLAMERSTVTSKPRTFFDLVVKNSITTELISPQVGGGFSLSSSTPRIEDWMKRIATEAQMYAATAGAVIDANLLNIKDGGLRRKVVEIGAWNMDADFSTTIPHGISSGDKIRTIDVVFRNDANDSFWQLTGTIGGSASGDVSYDNVNIQLTRYAGTIFDSPLFSSTLINRGWVTIDYIS